MSVIAKLEPLVPWSNRISGGGFVYQDRFHPLAANWPPQKHPLHGNGFQVPWQVVQCSGNTITLGLRDAAVGPFRYAESVCYEIRDCSLETSLTVENQADAVLPYGMGFHPWFPGHPGTRLRAPATSVWHENADHLPTHEQPLAAVPEWDFSDPESRKDTGTAVVRVVPPIFPPPARPPAFSRAVTKPVNS